MKWPHIASQAAKSKQQRQSLPPIVRNLFRLPPGARGVHEARASRKTEFEFLLYKQFMKQKKITQSGLAAKLGITRQLLAFHIKGGNAPKLSDEEGWIEFLAVNGREGSLPPEIRKKIADQRLRLIRGQADRVEIENRVKRGETIEFDLVHRFIGNLTGVYFFGELERIANEFPSNLKGKSEIEIHAECGKQIEVIKTNLRARVAAWVKSKGKS